MPPDPAPADGAQAERERMVREQVAARGVRDERVLRALREVPRHLFFPAESGAQAYGDHPAPIGLGQTISQPYMVGLMTEALELQGGERVLEIGTGSGYQTAILARLAGEVFTVERLEELSRRARAAVAPWALAPVRYRVGDGSLGWSEAAPFAAILVTAGAPATPPALLAQLAEGGRLVVPVGNRFTQMLRRLRRRGGRTDGEDLTLCTFVPLIGEGGWEGG